MTSPQTVETATPLSRRHLLPPTGFRTLAVAPGAASLLLMKPGMEVPMSSLRSLAFTVLGSLLLSAPAWAQADRPVPEPHPAAVSQINGIPVKIGERNEYIYTYRPW